MSADHQGPISASEDRQMSLLWFLAVIALVATGYGGYRIGKWQRKR